MTSFLRIHPLRDVFVDLILQMKLQLLAEIQLRFVAAEKRAQAKRKFVVPTHRFVPYGLSSTEHAKRLFMPQCLHGIDTQSMARWYIAGGQRDAEQEERANPKYARTQRACGNLARSECRRQIPLIRRHSAYEVGCGAADYRAEERQAASLSHK